MRYPKYLPEGGTIGFVAPSFGCSMDPYKSRFFNACEIFHKMGYQTNLGPNCFVDQGIGISNTPQKCAEEFAEAYLSDESDALISCGGGELMCEILEHVDFDVLKAAEPKWFMGYSDNTNLTYTLATICDVASIYGPNAPAYGREPWHSSLEDAIGVLTGEKTTVCGYDTWEREGGEESVPLSPYHATEPKVLRTFVGSQEIHWDMADENPEIAFQGRLLGGCMDCLANLVGTKFDHTLSFLEKYKEDGIIWFLEACDLNVYALRRAMWQMEQAGWFRYVKGFLFGRPAACFDENSFGLDHYEAVLKVAGEKGVPVITDVDFGHLAPMMPLVTGSFAKIFVRGNDVRVEMDMLP